MRIKILLCCLIMLTTGLTGCIKETETDECVNGTLEILTYDILALSDSMVDGFTEKTGYCVSFLKQDDAGGVLDQMMLTKDSPQADLMIGLDINYLQTAIENNLLAESKFVQHPDYNNISEKAFTAYKGPYAIPFDMGPVCLNYDERFVDEENVSSPTSLWNLTEGVWNGKTTFPSPVTSSPGRAFLVATIDYFENDDDNTTDAFDWWQAMADNGAVFTSGWTESYETYYTGGYGEYTTGYLGGAHLTVSYCQSPGVEAFFAENYTHSTSITLPRSTIQQIEYTGIIDGGENVEAAELFIEYLLSTEINSKMPENNYMYSVLSNQDLPEIDGYHYHADTPQLNVDLELTRIYNEMEKWLSDWQTSTN